MRSARDPGLARATRLSLAVLAALGALLSSTSCTLEPGQPWGRVVAAELNADFALPAERVDDAGRLLTSKSFAVALDVVVAQISVFTLDQAGDAAVAFDPARPPPGFSLCHNGHCHADDGRLVDFAQVAVEAGAAAGGASLVFDVGASASLRDDTTTGLPMQCADPCTLERGDVVTGRLFVDELHVRGLVFDVTAQNRVPEGGLPVDILIAPTAPVVAPLDATIERFEPIDWTIAGTFALAPSVLDPFDFEDGVEAFALEQAADEVAAASTLTLTFEPALEGDAP